MELGLLRVGLANGIVTLLEHALGPSGPVALLLQIVLGDLNAAFNVLEGLRIIAFQVLLQIDLSQTNLLKARLSGVSLRRADLSGARLSRANLAKANLVEAKFIHADLSKT